MRNSRIGVWGALGLGLVLASCVSTVESTQSPRALVIGMDGVRPDAILAAHTPNLDSLMFEGRMAWQAHAGGSAAKHDPTTQATSSGPGWTSILTGVWCDKHGVTDNSFEGNDLAHYPHFFERIRAVRPAAKLVSIANWAPINEHLLAPFPKLATLLVEPESDHAVASAAVLQLTGDAPDVLFLHFDEVDGAGHSFGYSVGIREYLDAVEAVDAELGRVLKALRMREAETGEDWLVIATTDHGGLGTGHGGQSLDERTIWIVAKGPGVVQGAEAKHPGHTIVARTVLEHMGIEIQDDWGLADSASFGAERP